MKFSLTVGVASYFTHVFGQDLLGGVLSYAAQRTSPTWEILPINPDTLRPNWRDDNLPFHLDGLILGGHSPLHPIENLSLTIPVVDVRNCLTDMEDVPSVKLNDRHIGRIAAQAALDAGYTHFWFADSRNRRFSVLRQAGFEETLAQHGHYADHWRMVDDETFQGTINDWIRRLPAGTAVFCANDQRAYCVYQGCARTGRIPGRQIGIIGVDNDPVHLSPVPISLTTIAPNFQNSGIMAARTLHNIIRGVPPPSMHQHNATANLIPGDSLIDFRQVHSAISREICRHIPTHVREGIPLPDLLKSVKRSTSKIQETFHQETGLTLQKAIFAEKMGYAAELLRKTNQSSDEIAEKLGYHTPRYFGKCFKKYYRESPLKYRADAQKPSE